MQDTKINPIELGGGGGENYSHVATNHRHPQPSLFNIFYASLVHKRTCVLYFSILCIYCICMVMYARYTYNLDDIWMWMDIYHTRPIFNGYSPEIGRFFPLASLDLNLLMQFSTNPYVFFTFNAIVVWILGCVVWIILQMVLDSTAMWLRIIVLLFILLHPGFVTTMVGICYPERLQMLCLGFFILASLLWYHKATLSSFIIGLISANMAIYLKEPTFLIVGVYGACAALIGYRYAKQTLVYYISLVASALVYLCVYAMLIYPNITKTYTRNTFENDLQELLVILKGLFNFTINDVFLVVLLPSLVVYRCYLVVRKNHKLMHYDIVMICGLLYLCAFLKLKLFENYYLMPIYIISFSSIVYFLFVRHYIKLLFFKCLSITCVVVFVINTLPIGINTFAFLKSEGVKLHGALDFIAKEARKSQKLHLYFDGNGKDKRLYATWYWGYFEMYLKELYDTHNVVVLFDESKLASGDYIMLNSSTNKMVDSAYLKQMNERYDLVYTSSAFGLPYIGLKPLIKSIFARNQLIQESSYGNANIFRLPTRDYIYKVP